MAEVLPPGVAAGARGLAGNPAEFIGLVSDTASALGMPRDYVVRDYWIASCLHNIFLSGSSENMRAYREIDGQREPSAVCLFTGGTALVSAWGITQRYSEDLDILAATFSAEASKEARRRARSEFSKWIMQPFGLTDKDVHLEDNRNTGYRKMWLPIGTQQRYLKVEFTSDYVEQSFYENRAITSLMGRFASSAQRKRYPELGGFELLCTAPAYSAANKLDALHRRAAKGQDGELQGRVRDLYDLACIAASPHADAVRTDIPHLAQHAPWSFGRDDDAVPRPASGYASGLVFKRGSQAQEALMKAYPQLGAIVWGNFPSFDEALELAASLDDRN